GRSDLAVLLDLIVLVPLAGRREIHGADRPPTRIPASVQLHLVAVPTQVHPFVPMLREAMVMVFVLMVVVVVVLLVLRMCVAEWNSVFEAVGGDGGACIHPPVHEAEAHRAGAIVVGRVAQRFTAAYPHIAQVADRPPTGE